MKNSDDKLERLSSEGEKRSLVDPSLVQITACNSEVRAIMLNITIYGLSVLSKQLPLITEI